MSIIASKLTGIILAIFPLLGVFSARLIGMSMIASLVILIILGGVFGMLFPFISVLAD
jgi:hypothetical protein